MHFDFRVLGVDVVFPLGLTGSYGITVGLSLRLSPHFYIFLFAPNSLLSYLPPPPLSLSRLLLLVWFFEAVRADCPDVGIDCRECPIFALFARSYVSVRRLRLLRIVSSPCGYSEGVGVEAVFGLSFLRFRSSHFFARRYVFRWRTTDKTVALLSA